MIYYVVGHAPSQDRLDKWRPLGSRSHDPNDWDVDKMMFHTIKSTADGEALFRQFNQKGAAFFYVVEFEL